MAESKQLHPLLESLMGSLRLRSDYQVAQDMYHADDDHCDQVVAHTGDPYQPYFTLVTHLKDSRLILTVSMFQSQFGQALIMSGGSTQDYARKFQYDITNLEEGGMIYRKINHELLMAIESWVSVQSVGSHGRRSKVIRLITDERFIHLKGTKLMNEVILLTIKDRVKIDEGSALYEKWVRFLMMVDIRGAVEHIILAQSDEMITFVTHRLDEDVLVGPFDYDGEMPHRIAHPREMSVGEQTELRGRTSLAVYYDELCMRTEQH